MTKKKKTEKKITISLVIDQELKDLVTKAVEIETPKGENVNVARWLRLKVREAADAVVENKTVEA